MGIIAAANHGITMMVTARLQITPNVERRESLKDSMSESSIALMSLENREMTRPIGVVSKNDIGALSTRRSSSLWKNFAAFNRLTISIIIWIINKNSATTRSPI